MRRIFTLIIVLTAVLRLACGQGIDETTAKHVAQNFLFAKTGAADTRINTDLELVYKATSAGVTNSRSAETYFYVFNTKNNNGFVIVAGNEAVIPVLAYSGEGDFDQKNIPQSVAQWLERYKAEIHYFAEHKVPATAAIREQWQRLSGEKLNDSPGQRTKQAEPLIQTKWNQLSYYNARCPANSAAGCVATSMAQIMHYWKYPARGTGAHTYNHDTYGPLTANFGETTYSWNEMPNVVKSANNAVATLIYQCGVSVDMNYSPSGSGAYIISARSAGKNCSEYAFKTYFGYKSTLRGIEKDKYDQTQWISLLKKELDAQHPVLYSGYSPEEGHTFIFDGYDNQDYFHINWGWGGAYDGYFFMNDLNPKERSTGGFNAKHQALIGIEPADGTQDDTADATVADLIKIYPNPAGKSVSIFVHEFNGIVNKVTIMNTQGQQVFSINTQTTEQLEIPVGNLPDGSYILQFHSDRGVLTKRVVIKR